MAGCSTRSPVAAQFLDLLRIQNDTITEFITTCELWLDVRNQSLKHLNSLADDIDTHHKNVNYSTLAGACASAVGGLAVIGGIIFAPVTGGGSVVVAGTVVSLVGGATAIGSSLTKLGITYVRCKDVQKYLDQDKIATERLTVKMRNLADITDRFDTFIENTVFTDADLVDIANGINYLLDIKQIGTYVINRIVSFCGYVQNLLRDSHFSEVKRTLELVLKQLGYTVPSGTQAFGFVMQQLGYSVPSGRQVLEFARNINIKDLANVGAKELGTSVKGIFQCPAQMSKALKVGVSAFSAVFIVVDIWSIVKISIDIHRGSSSVVGNKVRDICAKFIEGKNDVANIKSRFENMGVSQ